MWLNWFSLQKNVGKLFVSYGEIASVFVRADNKDPNSKFA